MINFQSRSKSQHNLISNFEGMIEQVINHITIRRKKICTNIDQHVQFNANPHQQHSKLGEKHIL